MPKRMPPKCNTPRCPSGREASVTRFHSPVSLGEPVSRLRRRALPLPLPDAPSRRPTQGGFQPVTAPLCMPAAGTLSVHRGLTTVLYYQGPSAVSSTFRSAEHLPARSGAPPHFFCTILQFSGKSYTIDAANPTTAEKGKGGPL